MSYCRDVRLSSFRLFNGQFLRQWGLRVFPFRLLNDFDLNYYGKDFSTSTVSAFTLWGNSKPPVP